MKTKSLFLITILTCSACSSSTSESTASDSFDPRILEEVVAEKTAHQQVLTFNGLVAVNEDKLYQYKAPEEGIVEQIYFAMGDFIQKGERLLTFKSPHYNALQNELLANRKNVAIQQRGLASAKSLYEDQLLSHEEYLTAESNLELAQQELAQVQNTLAIYGTPIADNLFEIRSKVGSNIQRALYFHVHNGNYLITHGFTKKTNKTPKREIEHAKRVRLEWQTTDGGAHFD